MLSGRLFTYDDMLTRLRDALADPERGPAAAARLRARYRVVMVDEFQDTDPVQWDILRRAFVGTNTVILIGDPKQAIYAFRGADVYSYLGAVAAADQVQTLSTNWRSDAALLDGLDRLMGGAALGGSPRSWSTRCRPTTPTGDCRRPTLRRPLSRSGFRVIRTHRTPTGCPACRCSGRGSPPTWSPTSRPPWPRTGSWSSAVSAHRLRTRGHRRPGPDQYPGRGHPRRPRRGRGAGGDARIRVGLRLIAGRGLADPARRPGAAPAGHHSPGRADLFRRLDLRRHAATDEPRLSDLTQRVRRWSRVLAVRGVRPGRDDQHRHAAGGAPVGRHRGRASARRPPASRTEPARRHGLRPARHQRPGGVAAGPDGGGAGEQRTRGHPAARDRRARGQRADRARSKGLEFPLVYLPDAWDRHVSKDDGAILRLHDRWAGSDPASRGECALDVGGRWGPGRSDRWHRCRAEDDGEDLRLFYVARAQCQLVTWWAPSYNTAASALQRRLLYRPVGGDEARVPAPALRGAGQRRSAPASSGRR